jgi:acetylornithine/succinyldiaminopimelate/putrescine aminotransferase
MEQRHPLMDSFDQILEEQLPNLFRLYLNPYVTQTCFCLNRYVRTTWAGPNIDSGDYQSFLANGFDEALSGAIKLARYCASMARKPTTGLVLDPSDRLGPFASAAAAGGAKVDFVPGLVVVRKADPDLKAAVASSAPFGFLVFASGTDRLMDQHAETIRMLLLREAPIVIICIDRESMAGLRRGSHRMSQEFAPDIVVFDETFVDRVVPFGAFSARKNLYDHWNKRGKTTFHSTTYQPNTLSSLHFMKCLPQADPEFHMSIVQDLQKIDADLEFRGNLFRSLYSPSLYRMIRITEFATANCRAAGDFVTVKSRPIFDAVSGVACSIRGHNPLTYVEEMLELDHVVDCEKAVATRLRAMTGLECMLPAVSGATAVENALKLALVAQHPKRFILALRAGFGGKTLLALAGTASPRYKVHIDPLYADVVYVDPFAANAEADIEAILKQYPVAVVQVELIQAVGGVRRIPERVIRYLEARRQHWGYVLLVDEVQTGMYRTGPFTMSGAMGLAPDILLLGKGTSDMMFPFALALYSADLQAKLAKAGSDLPAAIRQRFDYEFGYKTVLNILMRAEELSLPQRVAESSALFAKLLGDGLAGCKAVREVRIYGLLIGIELDATRWPERLFRKQLYSFYLYCMLRHQQFPVLAGFCQCEPNVLKITPSLTVEPKQIRQACATITEVLQRPFHRLLSAVIGGMVRSLGFRRTNHEHDNNVPADELVAR